MPDADVLDPRAVDRLLARMARAESAPWLHQEVARRMAERLVVIRDVPQAWIDWWGFTGGGAAAVQQQWPEARRIVVEPTAALAQRSREAGRRRGWWPWPRHESPLVLGEDEAPPPAQMLWANMVLHACARPVATLQRWHAALPVGGFVMFSTFGPDSLRELRELYADAGWPAPHAPFVDMHDLGDQLVQGGFADPVMDQETLWLTWSSPQALLEELRGLGQHLGRERPAGLRTPRWRQRLEQALQARRDDQGRIRLRFEIVYGHAYKAAPRPARGEPAVVSLEQLRANLGLQRPRGDDA